MLEEALSLRDVAQQELHGDAQLGHVLLEARSRVLRSLAAGLQEVTVSLGVSQLDSLDAAQVVVVPSSHTGGQIWSNIRSLLPGPLAVAGLLGEGALEHEFVRLVVEVVVEVVPQQTVDQHGLALEVIPQSSSPEPCVQSRP